ncbi:hypothetical protein HPB50_014610 [Hyalomma asiaticum]|uniref:Uncharacterized protein n=2 Tax=Hyalomma asiaticum TaxID=266040 RepID=A0ACB7THQ1_HYAAI|nr:hypothetical protein HPB50_008030 [Hyalomma asiaticum]KAH6946696.1 hypothetical protein HPB50_014610 [Hyalomma asiaticum]
MDEVDAEEAATAGRELGTQKTTLTKLPVNTTSAKRVPEKEIVPEGHHPTEGNVATRDAETASAETLPDASSEGAEAMDTQSTALTTTSQVAGKRTHGQTVEEKPGVIIDEGPPPKTAGARRASVRPRSSVSMETRLAGKPPP